MGGRNLELWIRNGTRRAGWVLLVLTLSIVFAYGFNSILNGFLSHYSSTTIPHYTDVVSGDGCLTCHTPQGRGAAGNAYKKDLALSDVASLDLVDSDGDGVDNQTEASSTRIDFPTELDRIVQVGYNPGLIDCPDGRLGYDPFSMQVVTGVHETPPGGTIWMNESLADNCDDGLDNDCDGLIDSNDPDCAGGCTSDAECDNGMFCDGAETCVLGSGECVPGVAPVVDDGIDCTVDFCNEDTDSIVHNPSNTLCDDTLFCTGVETCNASTGCVDGSNPCPAGEECDESGDTCMTAAMCTSDPDCDDGQFCNGAEFCDSSGQCQMGAPPALDDSVGCTEDFCDEAGDIIRHTAVDTACDDGQFCNGAEFCDQFADCQDGLPACEARQICNEQQQTCVFDGLDLDIASFRAPHRLRPEGKTRDLVLVVRNEGLGSGTARAVLTSMNEGGMMVVQDLVVSDAPGNGRAGYRFRFPIELGGGDIQHHVVLEDDDPDVDEAYAFTFVAGPKGGTIRTQDMRTRGNRDRRR